MFNCTCYRAVRRRRGSEERKAWRASTRDGSTREGLTRSITHVLSEIYGMKHEIPYIALHGRAVRLRNRNSVDAYCACAVGMQMRIILEIIETASLVTPVAQACHLLPGMRRAAEPEERGPASLDEPG